MFDIAHTNVTVIIAVTPYEQSHGHPCNPFLWQSHSRNVHRVNEPLGG